MPQPPPHSDSIASNCCPDAKAGGSCALFVGREVIDRPCVCFGVGGLVELSAPMPQADSYSPARGSRILTGLGLRASFGTLPAAFRLDLDGFCPDPAGP